ncbi:MAG: ABC transporter ATP-binding protein [Bacteroidetes bacterium]|nr:ABC transporter ATP-binding protein [Bacteroidota bacterium]
MKELSKLNRYLWQYKKELAIGLLFVILSNYFAIRQPKIVRDTLDKATEIIEQYQSGDMPIDPGHVTGTFIGFGIKFLIFALISGVFLFLMRQMIIVASRKIEKQLKDDIYAHLQSLSMSFYRKYGTGDIMARVTEDVANVRMYLGPGIMYTINFASNIVLVLIVMFSVNVKMTFYVLLPMPVLAISIYYVNKLIHDRSTILQEQMSRISTYVQEMYSGIRVIKAFAAERKVIRAFEGQSSEYRNKALALVQVNALFIPLILFLIGLCNLITIYIGGQLYMAGGASAGNIAEFFMYVGRLTWPVAAIGWVTAIIQRAAASQKRINELMDIKPDIVAGQVDPGNGIHSLEFENVSFSYPGAKRKAISGFNLTIRPGQKVGLVGRTGSGKTTLVNLLLRQYDPSNGSIRVNGIDLRQAQLMAFRQMLGVVPQDSFLFSESLYNNVLWGGNGVDSPEKVEEVLQIADLAKDLDGFPKGLHTLLGERGITLSGGQKQRLSIARALYRQPQVLVFDDSFSAVDTNTEAKILEQLNRKKVTTIIVSHRVSTVMNADLIVVLDQGRIIEQGNHKQLLDIGGYYHSLHKKQLLETELSHAKI